MSLTSISNFLRKQAGRAMEYGGPRAQSLISGAQSRLGALSSDTMRYKGRTALAKSVSFIGRNQGLVGAGLGGVAGYMTGGTGGAMLGAAVGGIGGGRGSWASYRESGTLGSFQSKVGSRIAKYAPGISKRFGSVSTTGAPRISGSRIDLGGMRLVGKTESGGRALGGMAVGVGAMAGAGALAGVGFTAAAVPFRAAGSAFGSAVSATYGNSFSGMGNGTVTGY